MKGNQKRKCLLLLQEVTGFMDANTGDHKRVPSLHGISQKQAVNYWKVTLV